MTSLHRSVARQVVSRLRRASSHHTVESTPTLVIATRYDHSSGSSNGSSPTRGTQHWHQDGSRSGGKTRLQNAALTAAAAVTTYALWRRYVRPQPHAVLHALQADGDDGRQLEQQVRGDLPTYTKEEVAKHKDVAAGGMWVTYGKGVYNVSDFSKEHPGGDKILLAVGGALEPFWSLYAQHKTKEVAEILEGLRVGNLDESDVSSAKLDVNDPFVNDPSSRHPALRVQMSRPFNAETPVSLLADSFVTPNALFFVRNHLPVPKIDDGKFRLSFKTETSKNSVEFTVAELKKRFETVDVTSVVQCAGNRRSEMNAAKAVRGTMWGTGAISNAKWTGIRLRDFLTYCGVNPALDGTKHVHFWGLDTDPTGNNYGASITIEKAMSDETIIAFEMNGEPLPVDHGYPLRVIVPGVVGARQVKWLSRIQTSKEESPSHWQQNDYRAYSPAMDWDCLVASSAPSIQEGPVTSAICSPAPGATVYKEDESVDVQGYAWSGGGRSVSRVDVSADGGVTWHAATLETCPDQGEYDAWSWALWRASVPIPAALLKGGKEGVARPLQLLCKATDRQYNTQPEDALGIWNMRGLVTNSWHRVTVNVE